MHAHDEVLATFLLDAGVISHTSLAEVRARTASTGEPLGLALVLLGVLSEDEVRHAVSKVLGIPQVTLEPETIMPEALVAIPEPFARAHGVVGYALRKEKGVPGQVLEVALLEVSHAPILEELSLPYTVRLRLTDRASLTSALLVYQKMLQDSLGSLSDENESPTDALLERALYSAADALYLRKTEAGFLVQYHMRGGLYDALRLPVSVGQAVLARLGELAHISFEGGISQEGNFKIKREGEAVGARVMTLPGVLGPSAAVMFASEKDGTSGSSLEWLGLHGDALTHLRRALRARKGLVLVAGDESFQKTALLYGLLDIVGSYTHRVITIEEQVSTHLPFALQTEIPAGGEVSSAARVRAALLQDPDILMVSVLADKETALLLLEAANRGVFVLVGVRAPSAASGIEKICAFGVSLDLLASTLVAAVGVSAVRALCSFCSDAAYKLSRSEMATLERDVDFSRVLAALKTSLVVDSESLWRDVSFVRPGGCGQCQGGYSGSMSLREVFPGVRTLQAVIKARDEFEDAAAFGAGLVQKAREAGALTRLEDGFYKAAQGKTSLEEVLSIEA